MPEKNSNQEQYISLTEATKYCDYTQEYLSLRARQGKLKARKFGRNWVTTKEWVIEYFGGTNSEKARVQEKKANGSSLSVIASALSRSRAVLGPHTNALVWGLGEATRQFFASLRLMRLPRRVATLLAMTKEGAERLPRRAVALLAMTKVRGSLAMTKELRYAIASVLVFIFLGAGFVWGAPALLSAKDSLVEGLAIFSEETSKGIERFSRDVDEIVASLSVPVIAREFSRTTAAISFSELKGGIAASLRAVTLAPRNDKDGASRQDAADIRFPRKLEIGYQDIKYGLGYTGRMTTEYTQWLNQTFVQQPVYVVKQNVATAASIVKQNISIATASVANSGKSLRDKYLATNNWVEDKIQKASEIPGKLSNIFSGIINLADKQEPEPEPEQEIEIEEVAKEFAETGDVEKLQQRIKELEARGYQQKEIIKEVKKITQIQPVQKITKQTKILDSQALITLAGLEGRIDNIEKWEKDIRTLQSITKKLQANPPTTAASTAPIYIGSQGIQVGGAGIFSSLGVSGSAGLGNLGVGGATSLGSTSNDTLTVNASSNFNSPITISSSITHTGALTHTGLLTQSGGQVTLGGNVDATAGIDITGGDLTIGGTNFVVDYLTGDLVMIGDLSLADMTASGNVVISGSLTVGGAGTGAVSFTASSTSAAVSVTQTGTGSIFSATSTAAMSGNAFIITNLGTGLSFIVQDDNSDASPFVIAADGKVGIGTTTPAYALDVIGTGKFSTSLGVAGTATTTADLISFAGAGNIIAVATSTWQTTSGSLAIISADALNLTGAATSTWQITSGSLAITSADALNITAAAASLWKTTSGQLTIQTDTAGDAIVLVSAGGITQTFGSAYAYTIQRGTQAVFAIDTSGAIDLTARGTHQDISIVPSGTGNINFHATSSASYYMNSTGDLVIGGRFTFESNEYISNETDGLLLFQGSGGTNNNDFIFDLDGAYPVLYSASTTKIGIDDDLEFVEAQTISTSAGDLTLDAAIKIIIADALIQYSAGDTAFDVYSNSDTMLTIQNTGTGVSHLKLADGSLYTGSTERLTVGGALTNITGYTQPSGIWIATTTSFTLNSLAAIDITAAAASDWRTSAGDLTIAAASVLYATGTDIQLTATTGAFTATSTGNINLISSTGKISATSSDYISFGTNAAERMRILSGGNVGIATTTPAYALDVWGDARFGTSTDGALFVDASTQRIGIGTTTPSVTLEVIGSIVGSGNITIAGDLMPSNPRTQDIGSSAYDWQNIYAYNVYADNLYGVGTVVSINAELFTINADAGSDETSELRFYRGADTPHALVKWDAPSDKFHFNFPLFLSDAGSLSATTTLAISSGASGSNSALDITATGESIWKTTSGALTIESASALTATSSGHLSLISSTGSIFATSSDYISFGAGNTERMRILSGGNVGIATTTPAARFTVNSAVGSAFVIDSSGYVGLATTSPYARFAIDGSDDVTQLLVQGVAGQSADLAIFEDSAGTDVFVLDGSGNAIFSGNVTTTGNLIPSADNQYNLGSATKRWANVYGVQGIFGGTITIDTDSIVATSTLGISSGAGTALNITGAADSTWKTTTGTLTIESASALTATSSGHLSLISSTGSIFATSSDYISFGAGNTERMRILSGGNVGIATTTPAARFTVNSAVGSAFVIDSSGYVGLATTSPYARFTIDGSDDVTQLLVQGVAGQSADLAIFEDSAGTDVFVLDGSGNAIFSGNVTTTGNLIPSADNQYNLGSATKRWANVYGVQGIFGGTITIDTDSIVATSTLGISSGAGTALNITGAADSTWKTTTGTLTIESASALTATSSGHLSLISSTGSIFATSSDYISFGAGNTERMRILSGGNVGIATTTPAARFTVNSAVGSAFVIDSSGYVGLATTSPYARFTIDGSDDVTQLLVQGVAGQSADLAIFEDSAGTDVFVLDGSGNAIFSGNVTTTGNLIPSADNQYNLGSATKRWANVYGVQGIFGGTITIDTDSIVATSTLGISSGAGTALNITGAANSTWKIDSADLTIQTETSGALTIESAGTFTATSTGIMTFGTNYNPRLTILADGKIGIGTETPDYALDIVGKCVTGDTLLPIVVPADPCHCEGAPTPCHSERSEESPGIPVGAATSRLREGSFGRVATLPQDDNEWNGLVQNDERAGDDNEEETQSIKYIRIDEIKGGEMVLSLNENTGKLVPARIKGLLDMGVKPILKMTTEDGRFIRTTGNHPYLTRRSFGEGGPNPQWRKVTKLKEGDEIAVSLEIDLSFDAFVGRDCVGNEKQSNQNAKYATSNIEKRHSLNNLVHNYLEKDIAKNRNEAAAINPNRVLKEIKEIDPLEKTGLISALKKNALAISLQKLDTTFNWLKLNNTSITYNNNTSDSDVNPVSSESDIVWQKIESIEEDGYEQVWDIEVEGTHNFVAGHFVDATLCHSERSEESPGIPVGTATSRLREGSFGRSAELSQDDNVGDNLIFGGIIAHNTYISSELSVAGTATTSATGLIFNAAGTISSATAKIDITAVTDSVWKTTTGTLTIESASTLTATSSGHLSLISSTGSIFATSSDYISFGAGNTERMRILSGGNVGIATTTPAARFTVNSAVGSAFVIDSSGYVGLATTSPYARFTIDGSDDVTQLLVQGVAGQSADLAIFEDSAGTDVFVLDGSGNAIFSGNVTTTGNLIPSADNQYNLGSATKRWANVYGVQGIFGGTITIDTDSIVATSTLGISSGAGTALNITGAANSTWKIDSADLTIQTESSGALTIESAGTFTATSTGIMTFGTNYNPRLTILADGKIGIGDTTPSYDLQVAGTGQFDTSVGVAGTATTSATGLIFNAAGTISSATAKIDITAITDSVWKTTSGTLTIESASTLTATSSGDITLLSSTGSIINKLGDAAGSDKFYVKDSAGTAQFTLDSNGNMDITGAMYQPVYGTDDGLVLYIPFSEKIGDEVLTDNDLENWDANWTKYNENAGTRDIANTTDEYSGTNAVLLTATADAAAFGISQAITTTANDVYQLNAWFKYAPGGDGLGTVRLEAYDTSGSNVYSYQEVSATTTAYSLISLRFTPTDVDTTIRFKLTETNGSGSAHIDLISLKKADTTYAYDYSPYGNDGTIATNTTGQGASYYDSKYGQGMAFDGKDDYVDCGSNSSLNITDAITVEAWVKITQDSNRKVIASKANEAGNNFGWSLEKYSDNKIRFDASPDGTTASLSSVYSNEAIPNNIWTHVIGVVDGNNNILYINGIQQDDVKILSQIYSSTINLYIGQYISLRYFNGSIDEVRIYDRAISADEVKTHYLRGTQAHGVVQAEKFRILDTDNVISFQIDGSGNAIFSGNVTTTGNILPTDDDTYDLGSATKRWANVYGVQGIFGGTITIDTDSIVATSTLGISSGAGTALNITGAADSTWKTTSGTLTIESASTLTATSSGHLSLISSTGSISATSSDYISFATNDTERMRILSDGKIGIGTAAPSYLLDVYSTDTTYLARIYNTSSNAAAAGLTVRTDGDGNLLLLNAGGTDIVVISEAQSTFNNPVSMAAAGDVSIAYDLLMANTSAGNIKFSGPGYIETDSTWQNLDLTLRAANTGKVIVDDNMYISGNVEVVGTIENGLVAWWTLDEGAGLAVADKSNNSNDGTITGHICPSGYALVPGNSTYNTSDFCVMKYEAKEVSGTKVAGTCLLGSEANTSTVTVESTAATTPLVSINLCVAKKACTNSGGHLITNNEWMTIARNIEQIDSNWSSGVVGTGKLKIGNNGTDESGVSYDGSNPDYGTGRGSTSTAKLALSNGEELWDISGNVWEWTNNTITEDKTDVGGNEYDDTHGITGGEMPDTSAGVTASAWQELTALNSYGKYSYNEMRPSDNSWNSTQGMGQIYLNPGHAYSGSAYDSSIHAFLRGGNWGDGAYAGAFALYLNTAPSRSGTHLGCRCVR